MPKSDQNNRRNKLKQLLSKDNPKQTVKRSTKDIVSSAKDRLIEGKFRYLNEMLYTSTSDTALRTFQKEPHLFQDYHKGFQLQVSKWPVNPVDVIYDKLRKRAFHNQSLVVADMGCGEAELARKLSISSKKMRVHSFDLVKHNEFITVANIKSVPLPDTSCDIVVFCLSLMGTDYVEFLNEANRILKVNGTLLVAEVKSRIEDIKEFSDMLKSAGFKLKHVDSDNKMFVMFDCVKATKATFQNQVSVSLKACKYKRR